MSDAPKATSKSAPCPICGKPAANRYRPFCSPRCAEVDLGRWLTGQYRLPGAPAAEDAEDPDRLDPPPRLR